MIYENVYTLIRQVAGSDYKTNLIFPLAGSIMVFLLFSNLLGLVPGIGAITGHNGSVFRTPTADINTTLPLALFSVFVAHVFMVKEQGVLRYLGNFIKIKEVYVGFRKGLKSGFMSIIDVFMGLLDIVGEIAKVLSMSLRLFGNMFAGDVLMTILMGIFAFGIPALWLGMSLLSAVIQAIVFASLVTIFFSLAVSEEKQ